MSKTTPGKRAHVNENGHLLIAEGEYGKDNRGVWMVRPPGCNLGDLSNHSVQEHEDGTITVAPSILVTEPNGKNWHGYLRKGIWEEV